jgi:hypothetical protein
MTKIELARIAKTDCHAHCEDRKAGDRPQPRPKLDFATIV